MITQFREAPVATGQDRLLGYIHISQQSKIPKFGNIPIQSKEFMPLSTKAYGMLVHEGPDVTAILWTMLIMTIVITGPMIAYIVCTKDVQSASGMAAWAFAVLTLLWMHYGLPMSRSCWTTLIDGLSAAMMMAIMVPMIPDV